MPWADPEKNAEAVRKWRASHPGYWRRYPSSHKALYPINRYKALEEDLSQQRILYKLSRRKVDCPEAFRIRERRWIQATDFWSGELDGSGTARRRSQLDDEETA